MPLITNEVNVKLNGSNISHYKLKGYEIPIKPNKKTITVKVEDLLKGSKVKVMIRCDYCGKEYDKSYGDYVKHSHNGITYCNNCKSKVFLSRENGTNWNPNLTDEERIIQRNYPEYTEFIKFVVSSHD